MTKPPAPPAANLAVHQPASPAMLLDTNFLNEPYDRSLEHVYIDRIKVLTTISIAAKVQAGRMLKAMKAEYQPGEWTALCQERIGGLRTCQEAMYLADRLGNADLRQLGKLQYSKVLALSRGLDEEDFRALAAGEPVAALGDRDADQVASMSRAELQDALRLANKKLAKGHEDEVRKDNEIERLAKVLQTRADNLPTAEEMPPLELRFMFIGEQLLALAKDTELLTDQQLIVDACHGDPDRWGRMITVLQQRFDDAILSLACHCNKNHIKAYKRVPQAHVNDPGLDL